MSVSAIGAAAPYTPPAKPPVQHDVQKDKAAETAAVERAEARRDNYETRAAEPAALAGVNKLV